MNQTANSLSREIQVDHALDLGNKNKKKNKEN